MRRSARPRRRACGCWVRLVYVTAVRTEKRDRIRRELRATGERAADAESTYKAVRSSRAALLLRIDAWGDPADGDDSNRNAELARMAGITRQAVLGLRERALSVNAGDAGGED